VRESILVRINFIKYWFEHFAWKLFIFIQNDVFSQDALFLQTVQFHFQWGHEEACLLQFVQIKKQIDFVHIFRQLECLINFEYWLVLINQFFLEELRDLVGCGGFAYINMIETEAISIWLKFFDFTLDQCKRLNQLILVDYLGVVNLWVIVNFIPIYSEELNLCLFRMKLDALEIDGPFPETNRDKLNESVLSFIPFFQSDNSLHVFIKVKCADWFIRDIFISWRPFNLFQF
jgi:hypothetical protein